MYVMFSTLSDMEDSLFSKNGFDACVRVVGRGEWSVQALRRIDLQPRLQCLVALGYIAAGRETCRSSILRGLSLPNLRSVSWPTSALSLALSSLNRDTALSHA
jgi:hypothetical protein